MEIQFFCGTLNVVASEYSLNYFMSDRYKTIRSFKLCFLLKIVPLCNYILLPATVKVLETFLEAIL